MEVIRNGDALTINVPGKLDMNTSPELERMLGEKMDDNVKSIVLDLDGCIYVSSAGLRVILSLEKKMSKNGGVMRIVHVPALVMEVFTETGLTDILRIE